jgi:carbamoyltransferase
MLILGLGGFLHDPAVALVENGKILLAVDSEKVTRHKQEVSFFPYEAVELALDTTKRSFGAIDKIAFNWSTGPNEICRYLQLIARHVVHGIDPRAILGAFAGISASTSPLAFLRLQEDAIPPVVPVRHHLAHVASSYLVSGFDDAVTIVVDGAGELECTSVWRCRDGQISKLWSMDLPFDSLGHVYTMATVHLGFRMLSDEYKVMGLAPFGERREAAESFFQRLIRLLPDGRYEVDKRLVGNAFGSGYRFPPGTVDQVCPPRGFGEPVLSAHADFARSLQARLEETLLHVARHAKKATGAKRLCLAGGVAMNAVANGRLALEAGFDETFVPPAAHDGGTPLGAALWLSFLAGFKPESQLQSACLGPSYDSAAVIAALDKARVPYRRVADPAQEAARWLANGNVIGWFQGAAEFGPRALGARSILADPRQPEMRDRINARIKGREAFRPFAPSVLAEEMNRYFDGISHSPFMTAVFSVRSAVRHEIQAAVHVDGTARPQSVSASALPLYHRLISAFCLLTGVPAVLNTSFNLSGEPIVLTPSDALRTFFSSGLDVLVLDQFVVTKPGLNSVPASL